MAITNDEKQSIINAVLSSIRTNSRTIDQLTIVTEVADTDNFEIHGGKRVAFSKLRELILSKSGVGAINDKLPELDDVVEFKEVRNDITLIATQQTSVLGGIAGSTDAGYGAVYDPTRKRFFLMYYGEEAQTDASVVTAYGNFADEDRFGASPSSGGGRVPVSGKLYLCKNDGGLYHWNGADLVVVAAKKHAITLQQAVAGTGTWSGPAFDDIRVGDTLTFTDTETQTATVFCEYKTSANARALCAAYAHANETNSVIMLLWLTDSGTYGKGGLPTSQTVVDWLDKKQKTLAATTDVKVQSADEDTDGLYLTDSAKRAVFVDMWNNRCKYGDDEHAFGGYLPDEAPDVMHPFLLNKIWMTYEEAIQTWMLSHNQLGRGSNEGLFGGYGAEAYEKYSKCKTYFPIYCGMSYSAPSLVRAFKGNRIVETLSFVNGYGVVLGINAELQGAFDGCWNLREILSEIRSPTAFDNYTFRECRSLTEIRISRLLYDVCFADSPLLSLASFQYLVTNAANTSAITVTVHADVFAKLTGDMTNEAAAALTDDEKAAWAAVLEAACAKNISFATA